MLLVVGKYKTIVRHSTRVGTLIVATLFTTDTK